MKTPEEIKNKLGEVIINNNCLINRSFIWTIKENIYIPFICYFLNNLLDAVANEGKSSSSLYL